MNNNNYGKGVNKREPQLDKEKGSYLKTGGEMTIGKT